MSSQVINPVFAQASNLYFSPQRPSPSMKMSINPPYHYAFFANRCLLINIRSAGSTDGKYSYIFLFKGSPQLSAADPFASTRPHRESLSGTIKAAGRRLVGGGCVRVAGGGGPPGIGGQIQDQQHRWDRAAEPHQGNAGVRAAHR